MSTFLGLALLVGILVEVGSEAIREGFASCDWALVAAAAPIYFLAQILRGTRWWYWLRFGAREVRFRDAIACYSANAFLANLTPARLGESLAPLLIKERCGIPTSRGAAVVAIDRAIDLAVLMLFLAASTLFLATRGEAFAGLVSAVSLGLAALALVLIVGFGLWARASGEPLPLRLPVLRSVKPWLSELDRAARDLVQFEKLALGGLMAIAVWSTDILGFYVLMNAFGPVGFLDNAAAQAFAAGAAIVSFVPGGIGVTTASYSVVMDLLGYPWQTAAVASTFGMIVSHTVRFVLSVLTARLADARASVPI